MWMHPYLSRRNLRIVIHQWSSFSCAWRPTDSELHRWPVDPTSGNVKLLLPPRQSRGNSHYGLGLPRSTTWKILKGGHKASGLSAMVISRMLSEPRLPPVVRTKILDTCGRKPTGFMGTARENCSDSRLGFGTPRRWGICGDLGHPPDGLQAQAL